MIRLEISAVPTSPSASSKDKLREFVIKVTDTGIGISEEDRKNLFEPNFKSNDRTSRALNT